MAREFEASNTGCREGCRVLVTRGSIRGLFSTALDKYHKDMSFLEDEGWGPLSSPTPALGIANNTGSKSTKRQRLMTKGQAGN